ncbi:tyrosine-type recombinase/integrase [Shewanella sp. SG41-4]|nr:tyrosine-type recombinase/integrase [Shewanella sp. SG41-4]
MGQTGKTLLKLEKTPLFLHFMPSAETDGNQRVKTMDVSTVTNLVKDFVVGAKEEAPFLKAIAGQCTGVNFRPTCALIMHLTGESFSKIQDVLNHAHSSTTQIYTQRLYSQSLLQTKMKNFQQFIVDNAQSIKKSDNLFDAGHVGVDEWINCDAQRIWFNDVDVIADWIAWETAINEAKDELFFSNPRRWEAYWEPRLLKYQNMLTIVTSTDMRNARVLAKKIVLPPLS